MSKSFATPWTVAWQVLLFVEFPRQEYWSGLPFPSCNKSVVLYAHAFVCTMIWQPLTYHWLSGKESSCQCRRHKFDPWVRKIPWRTKWQLTPVFSPGKSHGQRILVGYSPWGHKRVRHDLATKQQQYIIRQVMSLPLLATSFKQSFVHISE